MIFNFYSRDLLDPILVHIKTLADLECISGFGIISSTVPEVFESIKTDIGKISYHTAESIGSDQVEYLIKKLWSFEIKGEFPDSETSMKLKNYQCKAFQSDWKKYVKFRDEQIRPAKIAAATLEEPFLLFADIYTAEGIVFQRHKHTGRDISFPKADPLTFREVTHFYADKNYVWQRQLAAGSPPKNILDGRFNINNPSAIWEFVILDDADGKTFKWLFNRHDTMYWADKNFVYSISIEDSSRLVCLEGVKASEFKNLGHFFGTDQKQVFYMTTSLPLELKTLNTEQFFIWDENKVFYRDIELPLTGSKFLILGRKYIKGVLCHRLTDGSKTFVLEQNGNILPDNPEVSLKPYIYTGS
jgi:hypothetical protein